MKKNLSLVILLFLIGTCVLIYNSTKTFYVKVYENKLDSVKHIVFYDTIKVIQNKLVVKYKVKTDTLTPIVYQPKVIINPLANPDSFKQYEEEMVWQKVDNMPSFPGGEQEMMRYLASNVYYPDVAYTNGVEGRVVISFIVEKDGTITHIEIIKEIGFNCGTVCKEVVSKMPKWSIPTNKGVPVPVKLYLPIDFSLN